MRSEVWKYPLIHGWNDVTVPGGSQLLSVGADPRGHLCCWVRVWIDREPELMKDTFNVLLCWTGENIGSLDPLRFLNSFQTNHDTLVWHGFVSGGA